MKKILEELEKFAKIPAIDIEKTKAAFEKAVAGFAKDINKKIIFNERESNLRKVANFQKVITKFEALNCVMKVPAQDKPDSPEHKYCEKQAKKIDALKEKLKYFKDSEFNYLTLKSTLNSNLNDASKVKGKTYLPTIC